MAKVLVEGVEGTRARWDERPSRRYGCEGDHSYYLTDGPAKTVQRNGEKHRTDRGQCEELRPHHVDTRPLGTGWPSRRRRSAWLARPASPPAPTGACFARGVELPESSCSGSRISAASIPNCGIERASVAISEVVANRCSAAPARNSATEPSTGMRSTPCMTNTSAMAAASA